MYLDKALSRVCVCEMRQARVIDVLDILVSIVVCEIHASLGIHE